MPRRTARLCCGTALIVALVGCPAPKPEPRSHPAPKAGPSSTANVDADAEACVKLCAKEKACGKADGCVQNCGADAARMKKGFVAAYVPCHLEDLEKLCGAFDDAARSKSHDRCFDEALAKFPRDEANQRDMAEAVCNRGIKCQGFDKLARDACMQATLDPKEPEVKLGQRLVDALRRDRVIGFRKCVDEAPCPPLDTHDSAVDDCYVAHIMGAPTP